MMVQYNDSLSNFPTQRSNIHIYVFIQWPKSSRIYMWREYKKYCNLPIKILFLLILFLKYPNFQGKYSGHDISVLSLGT